MRIFILLLIVSALHSACASSEKNSTQEKEYSNLVQLNPPKDRKQEVSNIYIDTVESITQDNQKALLISGSFPDGCTRLKTATHSVAEDSILINLQAWREPEMICAQVLTSFSYIYDKLPQERFGSTSSIVINKKTYQIN